MDDDALRQNLAALIAEDGTLVFGAEPAPGDIALPAGASLIFGRVLRDDVDILLYREADQDHLVLRTDMPDRAEAERAKNDPHRSAADAEGGVPGPRGPGTRSGAGHRLRSGRRRSRPRLARDRHGRREVSGPDRGTDLRKAVHFRARWERWSVGIGGDPVSTPECSMSQDYRPMFSADCMTFGEARASLHHAIRRHAAKVR